MELGDAVVAPGLVDGHCHPVLGLDLTRGVDLSAVSTVEELIYTLRAEPRDQWICGWDLDLNVFGGASITHQPLAEAVGTRVPVYLTSLDAYSALASPKALGLGGITGPRESTSGASVPCNPEGRPMGHLLELDTMKPVRALLRVDEPAQSATVPARPVGRDGLGYTAGNAMDFEGDTLDLLRALEASGSLPMRWRYAPFVEPTAATLVRPGPPVGEQTPGGPGPPRR